MLMAFIRPTLVQQFSECRSTLLSSGWHSLTVMIFHRKGGFLPCTPAGILEALKRSNISLEGKHVVVVGRSKLVGLPLANMLIGTHYYGRLQRATMADS